jgi:hypothetical protein
MDTSCQQGTMQSGGGSILVWGVFIWHGLIPLVRLNTSLTGNPYVALLGDHLQPLMDFMYAHNDGIFKQDNAQLQRAQVVQNSFEHSGELRRMV